MNLGGHFVDLVSLLTGETARDVAAVTSDSAYGAGIEDYAALTIRTDGGAVAVIEAGYTFPSAGEALREFSFTLRSDTHYVTSAGDGLIVRDVARPSEAGRHIGVELRNERYYPMFVADTLERFRRGEPPACGLGEAVEVMDVMVRAYRSAQT
jgi:predicted dehydrogenase